MPSKTPALSIGLTSSGELVEIRVAGKKVKHKLDPKHSCPPGTKTVTLKLKFCKPAEKGGSRPAKPPGGGATPPCCMVIGGRVVCWPPCV